jgi:diguanylate cyclase (GGDEF)-like protein/PAS domain S-box-containing protein
LAALPDAVIVLDVKGLLRWGNHAAESLFGRSLPDSIGLSVLDLVHPADLELVFRSFASVQTKRVGTLIEVRAKTPSGWRLLEVIGAPVCFCGEEAVLFSLRDLTDRRRFEVAHNEESRFRSLVQNAAALIVLLSPTGAVESVSGGLSRSLGHDPELVEGNPFSQLVYKADRAKLAEAFDHASLASSRADPVTVEVRLLRHSHSGSVPFELSVVNLVDDPTVGGYVVAAMDITSRVKAEQELRSTLSLLRATLDSTADGILAVDTNRRITIFNRRFAEMWGLPDALLAKRDGLAVISFVMEQLSDPESFDAKVRELHADSGAEINDMLEFKDGRFFERYSRPQIVDGEIVGRVWSFRDGTERKRLENELSYQAFHDSLTGLVNKALFPDRLERAVARAARSHTRFAFFFLDLDEFKSVNDSLGHAAGDDLLRVAATRLLSCLRKVDTAARLGGDEFAVLVENVAQPSEAFRLARRILKVFRTPFVIGGHEISVTASIGVSFSGPGISSDQVMRNADLAMYSAKEQGKNRYVEFGDEMHALVAVRRATWSGGS